MMKDSCPLALCESLDEELGSDPTTKRRLTNHCPWHRHVAKLIYAAQRQWERTGDPL